VRHWTVHGRAVTLTLLKSSLRHGNTLLGGNKYARQEGDPRFTDNLGAIQSIVTSSSQNDSGLFETNLRDERCLPCEGAGVVSEWQIELPASFRQFDYDTISDVTLHVRYTAREGGGLLKQKAALELQTALNDFIRSEGQQGLAQVFSLRREFPTDWHRFLNPASVTGDQTVALGLTKDRFPLLFQSRPITVGKIEVFIKVQPDFVATHNDATVKLTTAAGDAAPTSAIYQPKDLLSLASWNGLLRAEKTFSQSPGNWTINAWLDDGGGPGRLDRTAIEDFVLVCQYTVG
jgi:Tc toxin complex TcA C-terminal TcB-binding domain